MEILKLWRSQNNRLTLLLFGFIVNYYLAAQSPEEYVQVELKNAEGLQEIEGEAWSTNDISNIWLGTPNEFVVGTIASTGRRLHVKFLSIVQNHNNSTQYLVYGKSKVNNNIVPFQGMLIINNIYQAKNLEFPEEEVGMIVGSYIFFEDKKFNKVGIFEGKFISKWHRKEGMIILDELLKPMDDGYTNNEFIGTWKGYDSQKALKANWGDYRIPISGDLDLGAGEFAPNPKYFAKGWKSYSEAWLEGNESSRKLEKQAWWK